MEPNIGRSKQGQYLNNNEFYRNSVRVEIWKDFIENINLRSIGNVED